MEMWKVVGISLSALLEAGLQTFWEINVCVYDDAEVTSGLNLPDSFLFTVDTVAVRGHTAALWENLPAISCCSPEQEPSASASSQTHAGFLKLATI